MKLLCSAFLSCLPLLTLAQQLPKPYPEDLRVKHVPFQEHNVVRLKATTFIATQIIFAKEEQIIAVEGGDTSGWMVTQHENLPNMIFLKPTQLNSNTNLTVVTTKHYYYFQVLSNKVLKTKAPQAYAIQFDYPEEDRAKKEVPQKEIQRHYEVPHKAQKNPKTLNWDYRFSGNPQLIPVHVYDDGRFTYFELTPNQPVPAIFAVNNKDGKESIVNLRQQGNTLIVQRLAPQFSLRNGSLVASVFNSKEINQLQQGRRKV